MKAQIRLKGEFWDGFMLRVVDVEKAVAARPPSAKGGDAPQDAFTVHIADAAAPWNQGAWRIGCSGGRLSAFVEAREIDPLYRKTR